jgi:hypothetical protein
MSKNSPKVVTYERDHEVIICTEDNEQDMLKEYFGATGRNVSHYDRKIFGMGSIVTRARVFPA